MPGDPVVPPGFELFRRGSRRGGAPWVTVLSNGKTLVFSVAAWDRLGRPEAVVFLVDRAERLIGFRPARPGERNANRVNPRTRAVSAGPLLRFMAPAPPGRYGLIGEDGPPHIDLKTRR